MFFQFFLQAFKLNRNKIRLLLTTKKKARELQRIKLCALSQQWLECGNINYTNKRKRFGQNTKNEGLASKYGEWLSGDILVFPRHLQQKIIPNEPLAQIKLREKGVLKDFEMQIELHKMRADEQRSVHEIDNKCCNNLKTGLVVK